MANRFLQYQMSTCLRAQSFHVFAITLLSLLLPLSFNILARLTSAHHLLSLHSDPPQSFLFKLLFNINPKFLYVLVFVITFEALIRVLIDRINLQIDLQPRGFQPRVFGAWFFLVAFQVSLGFGIRGSFEAGIDHGEAGSGEGRSMLNQVILFVGLHEVMVCWCSAIVRPVVVDGLLVGEAYEVKEWVERCALAASFVWLWWWKLRLEVESLVVVAETKRNIMKVELSEFLGWWLYCTTLLVGVFRIAKGVLWIIMKSWRCREVVGSNNVGLREDEEKV